MPSIRRTRESFERALLPAAVVIIHAVYLFAVLRLVHQKGHFVGDDILGFWQSRTLTFADYVFEPINVHYVPLHRLATWAVDRWAPMRFAPALLFLAALHSAAVAFLYLTLEQLRRTTINWVVVCLYATHVYGGVLLLWWSSGLHRLPYLSLSIAGAYFFVRHLKTGATRPLWAVTACFLLAFGFYPKAALIPLYLAGVALCLRDRFVLRTTTWVALAGWAFISAVYSISVRVFNTDLQHTNFDLGFQVQWQWISWNVFLYSTLGDVLDVGVVPTKAVALCWLMFAGYTIHRNRANWTTWAVAVVAISANFALLGVSNRTVAFGHYTAYAYRYYFELSFLLALFGGIALQKASVGAPRKARWPSSLAIAGALTLVAALSYQRFSALLIAKYRNSHQAAQYYAELERSVAALPKTDEPLWFAEGYIPPYILPLRNEYGRIRVLLELYGVKARFTRSKRRAQYRIANDGAILALD